MSGKQPILVLQVLTDFPIKKYSIEMKSSWVLILSLGLITVLSVSKAKPFGEELTPRHIGDAIEFDDGWLTKKKAYCLDVHPTICRLRKHQCFSSRWFITYRSFVSFVEEECPHTCGMC
ncbi:unnamed protein product [Pocillopora meandrina]|uniref:ShKT domain-containing protein n=1 Tax=Pocillopora meandrina TaxID=46732 RepID=A0AAU9WK41_9CNID|nr:unnamed protein product [Pocillopora meandrina]